MSAPWTEALAVEQIEGAKPSDIAADPGVTAQTGAERGGEEDARGPGRIPTHEEHVAAAFARARAHDDRREAVLRDAWAQMFPASVPWIADALDRTNYLLAEYERLSGALAKADEALRTLCSQGASLGEIRAYLALTAEDGGSIDMAARVAWGEGWRR